ncbi:MAG TPA: hypothetical protein DCL60_11215 [Armatimonadetes bacterium]|nr:hypothetical protein [Armatimonadota bacterium]
MKFKTFILGAVLLLLFSPAHAKDPEFRGLWVHNWNTGLLSPEEIAYTVSWAKSCNMNAIIAQVRRVGDAYYKSAFEPRAKNIRGGEDFDPFACVLREGRANGMEVHAWFNVFRVWTTQQKPEIAGHIVNLHPEWMSKDINGASSSGDGWFLDPGVPEVREYLVEVVLDLLSNYNPDGLSLDFVRYPGRDWGYNSKAVALFNKEYNRTGTPKPTDPDWCNWRRACVTETVRAISQAAHRIRPGIKVSAATISWGGCPEDFKDTSAYKYCFQDWKTWMQEGIIDAGMPMTYHNPADPKQSRWFLEWMEGLKRWSYERHMYCGLMISKGNVKGAGQQVSLARQKGLQGIVGFAWSQRADAERAALQSALKGSVFDEPSNLPLMPWLNTKELYANEKGRSSKMIEDIVKSNRSYRRFFEDRQISKEALLKLVELGRLSPSGANLQPLKYKIVNEPDMCQKVFPTLAWAGYLKDWGGPAEGERPSAYIVILGDTGISKNFGCDHGIAAQSIMLGASEQGLGGCMIGSINREELRKILLIPEEMEILLVLALGYPREQVMLEEAGPGQSIRYWRDENSVHHVPKRRLQDIVIG